MDLDRVDLTDLDLFAAGFPDDVFTALRREAPVWWHAPTAHTPDGVGFWVVSSPRRHHGGGRRCLELFSSERAPGADGGGTIIQDLPYGFAPGVLLNMMDDPLHHRIRRLVTPSVAPRALAADGGRAAGAGPPDRRRRGRAGDLRLPERRGRRASPPGGGGPDGRARRRPPRSARPGPTPPWISKAGSWGRATNGQPRPPPSMAAYGAELIAEKKAPPGRTDASDDDIISVVARPGSRTRDGETRPLTDLELLMFFNLLVVAGSETTRNSIALGHGGPDRASRAVGGAPRRTAR